MIIQIVHIALSVEGKLAVESTTKTLPEIKNTVCQQYRYMAFWQSYSKHTN